MLSVVCWKWRGHNGYRTKFTSEHVNVLHRMVERHYRNPHRFICVTDDAEGIEDGIEVVPLWRDHEEVASPLKKGPSCYRRLKAFSAEAVDIFGDRLISLDLDCVICGDVAPIWDRPEEFVMWAGNANGRTPYNGSMFLLKSGSRCQVWDKFDPVSSPRVTDAAGMVGSDQAWIGYCLGPNEAKWNARDHGVYSFQRHFTPKGSVLPDNARIVFFPGHANPWDVDVQRNHPWVREHWI